MVAYDNLQELRMFCCRMVLFAFVVLICAVVPPHVSAAERPNVVMIMTDNHGAWTLGCYGNQDVRTPNIDRLAQEGTLFENAFASNPVCSPTRATVLTGLIPSQHGVHCFLRGGNLQIGPQARCTLDEFRSLPEILKDAGYNCGLVGKWHLGGNLTPQEGLDDYWVTMPHGGTSTFYDAQIIEQGKVRKEPEYLTDFWTKHAVQFLGQQTKEHPFFLFLSYNGPYALSRLLLREGQNRHAEYYRDKQLPSFPRVKTHPWQLHNRDFINNPTSIRRVATEVSGVDDGVGEVMETLKQAGLDDNTIVVFLADQGWVGGQGGFFGMGDHTRPVTAVDGMMRIPMIWRQPGKVATNRRSDRLVANYDVLPTLLQQVGLTTETPKASPGTSFAEELNTQTKRQPETGEEAVFYEFESLRCIRTRDWKYTHRHPNGPHELYNLKEDPTELNNLYGRQLGYDVQQSLKTRLDAFYAEHASPKYDLWNGGGSQTVIYDGIEEEIAQQKPTPSPQLPEDFKSHEFTLPDGFSSELVAGPPLVTHPTMGCFDDRGRLFVCNNAGVNMSAAELEEKLPNSINMLEDQDGDGVFDKSTVFADRMTFPMGGAWYDGALYVASPPNIWRLEDTDGDGVADKRDVIVDKFGYTGNAASIHGCFFGPDGRLYWCDGYHGHEFKDDEGNVASQRKGSYIFSCRPDGRDVRIHCGGGMDNPVELDFTDEADVIGTVNILYTRPRVDCLVHWQYGGAYPHREAVLDELKVTGPLLEPFHRFGHVAISGTTRYRSGVMDHRWRDNFFGTFFNTGKVVRVELQRDGSSYAATQREFLSCSHRDFHPTDVIEDADGSLLVIDTGGWFYRGCPTSQIARPDVLGGIYRIRRDGMTPVSDARGLQTDWTARSNSLLLRDLKDTRHAVRAKVIAECVRRGDGLVSALVSTAKKADRPARRGAIYALTRIISGHASLPGTTSASLQTTAQTSARTAAQQAIRVALEDRDASIRQTACHAVTVNPDSEAVLPLIKRLSDDSAAVRRMAAVALGRIADKSAIPSLVGMLDDKDRNLWHAAAYALIEIGDQSGVLQTASKTSDAATRIRANVVAFQISPETFKPHGTPICEWPRDAALQQELFQFYRNHARAVGKQDATSSAKLSAELETVLVSQFQAFGDKQLSADRLTEFVAEFATVDSVARRVGDVLSSDSTSQPLRTALLAGVSRSSRKPHPTWIAPLVTELNSGDVKRIQAALVSAAQIRADSLADDVQRLAHDDSKPDLQLSAIECLLAWNRKLPQKLFDVLHQAGGEVSPSRSAEAVRLLSRSSLTKDQRNRVVQLISGAGPQQLRELVGLFQGKLDADVAAAFLTQVESARSFNSLPMLELSEVVKRFPPNLHSRANTLLDRLRLVEDQKVRKLDALVDLLPAADATRGRAIFFSKKSRCSACHVVGNEGKRVGPDLTRIGRSRSTHDLLESIVFPSSTIVRQYEPYTVLTLSGRTWSGLVVRDAVDSITVQQSSGEPVTIRRDDIDEVLPGTVSIMPKGLDEALTPQQLADLVKWLQTLR